MILQPVRCLGYVDFDESKNACLGSRTMRVLRRPSVKISGESKISQKCSQRMQRRKK